MKKRMALPNSRICYNCREEKPLNSEYFYRCSVRYFQRECKICSKNRRSKWWKTGIGKLSSKRTKLKRNYGITLEEYIKLLEEKNYQCEICGKHKVIDSVELCVDHEHLSGRIRGILCQGCNLAIGNIKESISNLYSAIQYLESYEKKSGVTK